MLLPYSESWSALLLTNMFIWCEQWSELLHTQVQSAALAEEGAQSIVNLGQSLFINFEVPTDSLAVVVRRRGTGECECRSVIIFFISKIFLRQLRISAFAR